ncbi:hypothetical protein Hanom_Chr04g00356281 [Helianthus anomalus]
MESCYPPHHARLFLTLVIKNIKLQLVFTFQLYIDFYFNFILGCSIRYVFKSFKKPIVEKLAHYFF